MHFDMKIASGFLEVTTAGEFSLKEATRTFREILDAVARHSVAKVLFDGRKIRGEPATLDRFLYGEFAAEAVVRHILEHSGAGAPQFAYVLEEPVLDRRKFGETVAVNRGMWVRSFDNLEEARAWLGVAPAGKTEPGGA